MFGFNLAACPLTILLNTLVMVAVKTRRQLLTHPNILLACLALAALMVGHVVQSLHIAKAIFLQEIDTHVFCVIEVAFITSFAIFMFEALFHTLLMSGE